MLGNRALLKAYSAGSKVLVFRGSKAQAYPCTTPGRFRFDGAYNVANWCQARTKKGVMIYKFKFKRVVADALHNHFLGPKPHATAPKVNISAMRLRFNRKKRRARLWDLESNWLKRRPQEQRTTNTLKNLEKFMKNTKSLKELICNQCILTLIWGDYKVKKQVAHAVASI